MTISGFETLIYTLNFLVPGFIINSVLSWLAPQRKWATSSLLLRFLTFSMINYGLWFWLIYLTQNSQFFADHQWAVALAWVVILLVSPILLAIIIAKTRESRVRVLILDKLKLKLVHHIPTAWDYKFHSIQQAEWVAIKLTDGNFIYGVFGSQSFASSEHDERDIYLQEVWVEEDGELVRRDEVEGILIKGNEVSHITFLGSKGGE